MEKSDWNVEAKGEERFAEYDRLRERCPVAHSEAYGGFWMLTRYQDITQAARDPKKFRSGRAVLENDFEGAPISLNPPEHALYRRQLNRYFSPERMVDLEPVARRFATDALTPLIESGSGDFATHVAMVVPARTLCAQMNMPDDFWQGMMDGYWALAQDADALIETFLKPMTIRLVEERRARPLDPETDLMSGILALEVNEQPISEEKAIEIGVLMFGAGHETTAHAISSAVHHLATTPADQHRLRTDPSLIPSAVEEVLRLNPPLHALARTAGEEIALHGARIDEGALVGLGYAAGNRDGDAFPDPDEFLVERSPNRHLSFGHGIHKCVGAPLARLELRVLLEELLTRTSGFELDGEPALAAFPGTSGYSRLPVRIDAA